MRDPGSRLRFFTCGSAGDGKSTLIGRLLGDDLHGALPPNAPQPERGQGIAADVRYHVFATERRSFIVADAPAHEQCIRRMVSGASMADFALLLVDASKGLSTQTRRCACIASMLGISHIVVAVNKMDLAGYSKEAFDGIARAFQEFAALLDVASVAVIPVCAHSGDNVTAPTAAMPWYRGPTLLSHLETVDIVADEQSSPSQADQFAAVVIWMDETPLLPGRRYRFQVGTCETLGQVTEIKYKIDVDNLGRLAAKTLSPNDIALCNIALDQPVAFDSFDADRAAGGFLIVGRDSTATAGAGIIRFALRRAEGLTWQPLEVRKGERASLLGQTPKVLWFTGLSGAGKSTIANRVEKRLYSMGLKTYMLDGDNVRHGLNRDLGFTMEDRVENVRRVAEVAKILVDAGLIVLVSLISPFRSERQMARELLEPGELIEIFVDTPLDVCISRDPKGLYRRAREGALKNLTGIDSPYEVPLNPDIRLSGTGDPDLLASEVVRLLQPRMNPV